MADTKLRYTFHDSPSIRVNPPSLPFKNNHNSSFLLSNSSFDHLSMFPNNSHQDRSPRSRQTTGSSSTSDATGRSVRGARMCRVIQPQYQHGQIYLIPPSRHAHSSVSLQSQGRRGRSTERSRPEIAERQAGSSLPVSEGSSSASGSSAQPEGEVERVIRRLIPDKMLLGSSRQRQKRVEKTSQHGMTITNRAREQHLAQTLDRLTHSPATVKSDNIVTPPSPKAGLLPNVFPASRLGKSDDGLGFGVIEQTGSSSHHISSPSASHEDREMTTADSPKIPSRSGSLYASSNAVLQSKFSWSTRGTSAGGSSLVPSYYCSSLSDPEVARIGRGGRDPSPLGRRQGTGPIGDLSLLAFPLPPPVPPLPVEYSLAPRTDSARPPTVSASRPTSMATSPHRIRRKPVPELPADFFQTPTPVFDLPAAETVSRPKQVYSNFAASKSMPAFVKVPIKDPIESTSPTTDGKANAMQAAFEHLRALSAKYRSRPFGRQGDADSSYTSMETANTTDVETPRESYEDFSTVPVRYVSREMALVPQLSSAKSGYMTRRQQLEAQGSEGVPAEKKGKGIFKKMFTVKSD